MRLYFALWNSFRFIVLLYFDAVPTGIVLFAGGGLPNSVPKLVFSFLYVNGRTFFVFFLSHILGLFGSLGGFTTVTTLRPSRRS